MKSMPTIKDIARIKGVSVTTVSKALNNHPDISATRRKEILEVARKLNYVPNAMGRSLRRQKTNLICVIISDNSNPYYASFLKTVEEKTSAKDYFTIIFNSNEVPEREMSFIANLRSLNVAGVIITPALGGGESVGILRRAGIPFVLSNRYISRNMDNYVVADDEEAGYIATKHALEKRRDQEVFFLGPGIEVSSARERLNGYRKALQEYNLAKPKDNFISGVFTQEQGYIATKRLIDANHVPYSIICYSDYIALGAWKALNESGFRMPAQVGLVGIDNIELFAFIHPSLTTVEIPKAEIGRKSVELLFRLIGKKENDEDVTDERIVLKPRLVVREST